MHRLGPDARLLERAPKPAGGKERPAAGAVGRCRFCGCTDLAPCQDNGDAVPCCWVDAAHTLCDNIQCIGKIALGELERMLEERGL